MSDAVHYDLIVFGGGNAISTAIDCGQAGQRVALVEKGPLGGTCPHRGCIPSKLLLGYADAMEHARQGSSFHFAADVRVVDPGGLLRETAEFTGRYDHILQDALGEHVTLYREHATFAGDRALRVRAGTITADRLVLATGSRPLPVPFDVPAWTSDDVFRLRALPRSVTIVGGGYIACELGHFFRGVGVDTLLVVRGEHLLEREDAETRAVFQRGFTARVDVTFGTTLTAAAHDGTAFRLTLRQANGTTTTHVSEALLFCTGRRPNTDAIGLERTGLRPDEHGYVRTDDWLRTPVAGVYAMGDVAGRYQFTHAASFESEYLAGQFTGSAPAGPIDYGPMPHAVFTSPEVAGVGATEEELKRAGTRYVAAAVPFLSTTKGRALKEEHGLCKFLVDPEDHRILGCHLVGSQASVLLHAVLPVMKWRNDIHALTGLIYVHPSLAEVVRGAARKVMGMVPAGCRDL